METVTGNNHRTSSIALPDTVVLRERLGQCTREAAMLRSLLRIAERAKRGRLRIQQRPVEPTTA